MSSSTVWGYKSTLHPNEASHYVGNRKKHLCSCNDLRCESLLWKAVTLTEEKTVSTPMLEPRAASNSTAMLTHVLLDQPPVQIQLDCRASCYVTPQCCKAATWHWKSGHTLVMHNKAIQKAAGKCGLSSSLWHMHVPFVPEQASSWPPYSPVASSAWEGEKSSCNYDPAPQM